MAVYPGPCIGKSEDSYNANNNILPHEYSKDVYDQASGLIYDK